MKIYKVLIYFPQTKGYTTKYFNINDKELIYNFLKEEIYKDKEFEIKRVYSKCSGEYYQI